MKLPKETLIVFALSAIGMHDAGAATLTLVNSSFESPNISPPELWIAGTPTGWTNDYGQGELGVQFDSTHGNQYAYFNTFNGWQILSQITSHTIELVGEQISLTAWMKTNNYSLAWYGIPTNVEFTLQLIFSGGSLASYLHIDNTTSTDWTLVTAPTYTTTAADIGKTVGVYMGFKGDGNWSQAFLDEVSLNTIPEPSAAILGTLGLFGFMRRRR